MKRQVEKFKKVRVRQLSLLSEMVKTDFKLRYQNSVLGYVWSALKPLFMFGILYTVFTKYLKLGDRVPNYPQSLLLAIILWTFFSEATNGSLKSIVSSGSLIRKIAIPRYLIPVSRITSAFVNMTINMGIFALFMLFASSNALSWQSIILIPVNIIGLLLLTSGLGFFLATFYVKLRDMDNIWDVVRQAMFYVVPVIYPISRIPSETVQKILILNPISVIIQNLKSLITYQPTETISVIYGGRWYMNYLIFLLIFAIFFTGLAYFRKNAKYFAEQV
jgi:ABC-2 type transport system permease protein